MQATEDTMLIRQAMAYAIELYHELTGENAAPTLGTQNQLVNFILSDVELRQAVSNWARSIEIDEATTDPPSHLPRDRAYKRIKTYLQSIVEQPVFARTERNPGDRR
jgi:hypothetical protein